MVKNRPYQFAYPEKNYPDCQKWTQSGVCPKLPDLRSVGDIALKPSLRKRKRE